MRRSAWLSADTLASCAVLGAFGAMLVTGAVFGALDRRDARRAGAHQSSLRRGRTGSKPPSSPRKPPTSRPVTTQFEAR